MSRESLIARVLIELAKTSIRIMNLTCLDGALCFVYCKQGRNDGTVGIHIDLERVVKMFEKYPMCKSLPTVENV